MSSDGFGDELSILEKIRLAEIMASEQHVAAADRDDVVQEAVIRAWRVHQDRQDASPALVHAAMRRRITETSVRGNWTGHEPMRGWQDAYRSVDNCDPQLIERAAEVVDDLWVSYHRGEIYRALSSLNERERSWVLGKYWGGMTDPELRAHGLSWHLWTSARLKLIDRLEHLRELIS